MLPKYLSFPCSHTRLAIMALFFSSGFTYAVWGVHVPFIKEKFHFSDGELSWALFAVAGGAILAMGPMGRWIARVGSRRACLWGGLALATSAAGLMLMPSTLALFPLLLCFGAANSLFDVAMNAQAALLEKQRGQPLMSGLHGLFSLGGLAGALAGSAWLGWQLPAWLIFALTAAVVAALSLGTRQHLLVEPPTHDEHVPGHGLRRQLLLLGGLAFIGLVAEGGMYDWSAVYMRDGLHLKGAWIGLGYAGFSVGMTLGRFFGDRLRSRWGGQRTLRYSGLLVILGIVAALALEAALPAVAGFALAGLGCANFMPVLMSRAAHLPGIASAEALALVGRLAYLGLLLGPVLIGFTAEHGGLTAGIGLVAVGGLIISLWSTSVLTLPPAVTSAPRAGHTSPH